MTVVKDSGARATLPPFGAEHEELRATVDFIAEAAPIGPGCTGILSPYCSSTVTFGAAGPDT